MNNGRKQITPLRRNDIDWLRIIGISAMLVIHVAKVFDHEASSAIKNVDRSVSMDVLATFITLWANQLFFFTSGWSSYISLHHRTVKRFLWERVRRLLIPFIAGVIVLCPALKFLQLSNAGNRESFVHFVPRFFSQPGLFAWYHLWFLIYLFAATVVFLPLMLWLRHTKMRITAAGRGTAYLILVLFVLLRTLTSPRWPSSWLLYNDWADFLYFSMFFMAGYFFSRYPAIEEAIQKQWRPLLLMSVLSTAILVPHWMEMNIYSLLPEVYAALYAVAGYCLVIGFSGFAHRFANTANVYLAYLREATFPIYVIHYAAITIVAFYVVRLHASIFPKYIIIIIAALAITMLAYQFLVRSVPPVRLLFGLPPQLKRHKAS